MNPDRSNDLDDAVTWLGDRSSLPFDVGSASSAGELPLLWTGTED